MYPLFFFLVSFPFPFLGVPTNNLFFFAAYVYFVLVNSSRDFRISRYLLFSLFIFIFFLFYVLSSDLPFVPNTILSYFRYVVAIVPLLSFDIVLKIFNKYSRISSLYSFYVFALFVFGILSLFPFCSTPYGGFCIFFQRSSSFGSVICPLVVFQLACIILSSIRLNYFLRLISIVTIILYLFLGLSLGARLYYILLFVALASLVSYFTLLGLPSLSKFRVTSKLRTAIFMLSSSLLISFFAIFYFSDLFISFLRLILFLQSPLLDYRFSSGLFFSTRSDQSLVQFLFGNQIFSELPNWNSTSVYDSTINLLLSDFGLVGLLLLFLILAISLYRPLIYLKKYKYSHFVFMTSIFLYVLASSTNEFLLLKSLNPFFVITTSLVASFSIADSSLTDS